MIAIARIAAASLAGFVLALGHDCASAQTTRTIRIVVPYAAGGAPDIIPRLLGDHISAARGVTVVVENRPGAGAVIGTEAVARMAPDGNTLLMTAAAYVINPHLRKVNYDPLTSFEPICHLVSVPPLIVVNATSPYRTLPELLAAARERPGAVTMASPGPGTTFHIALEMLKRAANVNITYVPYAGSAPALNALLGDHVTAVYSDHGSLAEQLQAGKVRPLATAAGKRIESLPDVPTVAELGFRDYEADIWFGVVTPARTPAATLAQLAAWFTEALKAPELKARLAALRFAPVAACGADFAAHLRKQYEAFGRTIRDANIKAE